MGHEVKPAALTDIATITHLAGLFAKESGNALPFDPVYFSTMVGGWIQGENSTAIGLYNDDIMVGVLLATTSEYVGAPVRQANELLWYIHPNARGKSALKMIDAYKEWARSKDASLIFIGAYENNAAPLYKRAGFTMIDTNWVCE